MNPRKMPKAFKYFAKVAKFRQIWSHCDSQSSQSRNAQGLMYGRARLGVFVCQPVVTVLSILRSTPC